MDHADFRHRRAFLLESLQHIRLAGTVSTELSEKALKTASCEQSPSVVVACLAVYFYHSRLCLRHTDTTTTWEALCPYSTHVDATVRALVCTLLGFCGQTPTSLVQKGLQKEVLEASESRKRYAAQQRSFGLKVNFPVEMPSNEHDTTIGVLNYALDDEHHEVKIAAMRAMVSMVCGVGASLEVVEEPLVDMLNDDDPDVRCCALRCLRKLSLPMTPLAIHALFPVLHEESTLVRHVCLTTISSLIVDTWQGTEACRLQWIQNIIDLLCGHRHSADVGAVLLAMHRFGKRNRASPVLVHWATPRIQVPAKDQPVVHCALLTSLGFLSVEAAVEAHPVLKNIVMSHSVQQAAKLSLTFACPYKQQAFGGEPQRVTFQAVLPCLTGLTRFVHLDQWGVRVGGATVVPLSAVKNPQVATPRPYVSQVTWVMDLPVATQGNRADGIDVRLWKKEGRGPASSWVETPAKVTLSV